MARGPPGEKSLRVKQRPSNYRTVEQDPADARQVDVLVTFPQTVEKPNKGRKEVGAPRHNGYSSRPAVYPDGKDLRDGHQHGKD